MSLTSVPRKPRRMDAKTEDELTRLLRAQARDPYLLARVALAAAADVGPDPVQKVLTKLAEGQRHVGAITEADEVAP